MIGTSLSFFSLSLRLSHTHFLSLPLRVCLSRSVSLALWLPQSLCRNVLLMCVCVMQAEELPPPPPPPAIVTTKLNMQSAMKRMVVSMRSDPVSEGPSVLDTKKHQLKRFGDSAAAGSAASSPSAAATPSRIKRTAVAPSDLQAGSGVFSPDGVSLCPCPNSAVMFVCLFVSSFVLLLALAPAASRLPRTAFVPRCSPTCGCYCGFAAATAADVRSPTDVVVSTATPSRPAAGAPQLASAFICGTSCVVKLLAYVVACGVRSSREEERPAVVADGCVARRRHTHGPAAERRAGQVPRQPRETAGGVRDSDVRETEARVPRPSVAPCWGCGGHRSA
jgi:hypothetical protein